MRRFTLRPGLVWLTRPQGTWSSLRDRVAVHLQFMETNERRRVAGHAFAVGAVACAALLRWILAAWPFESAFWLFYLAIALSAAYGGAAAALVATLLSFLLARIWSAVPLSTGLLFGVEGLLIAFVVLRLSKAAQDLRGRLQILESSILELKSTERQARLVDGALSRLDEASGDAVLILLDRTGHVTDWRAGARRLYGMESREMVGKSAATVFDVDGEATFSRLITEARRTATRSTSCQLRADGTTFDAEIELSPLSPGGFDGFIMVVRDLTPQQARAAADWSTAEEYARLRDEVDLARQQLSMIQDVTDPMLNSLTGVDFITTLLDRLRTLIDAEGIALINMGGLRRRVFCASSGLQCQRGNQRSLVDLRDTHAGRILMIHNDTSAVAEVSEAVWPTDVSSLIAVPVVRAGSKQAVLEVVNQTGRRATEWEIALVQVVAARIAGFLQDECYADYDSGAVA